MNQRLSDFWEKVKEELEKNRDKRKFLKDIRQEEKAKQEIITAQFKEQLNGEKARKKMREEIKLELKKEMKAAEQRRARMSQGTISRNSPTYSTQTGGSFNHTKLNKLDLNKPIDLKAPDFKVPKFI